MKSTKLKIDEEFRMLCPALAVDEYQQLERSIVESGHIRDPIDIWNDTIVDGHNRYKIAHDNEISFQVRVQSFKDRNDAKVWILTNQLGRRNLRPKDISIARGRLYKLIKKEPFVEAVSGQAQENEQPSVTLEELAKKTGVDERTLKRDAEFVEALDRLHPEIRGLFEGDMLNLTKGDVTALAEYDEASQLHFAQKVQAGECKNVREAIAEDSLGVEVEETHLDRMEQEAHAIRSWAASVRAMLNELPESAWIDLEARQSIKQELLSAGQIAMHYIGVGECMKCSGEGCKECRKTGWLPKRWMEAA